MADYKVLTPEGEALLASILIPQFLGPEQKTLLDLSDQVMSLVEEYGVTQEELGIALQPINSDIVALEAGVAGGTDGQVLTRNAVTYGWEDPTGSGAASNFLFTDLAGSTIANTTTNIQTIGYDSWLRGSAKYIYDTLVDAAYVTKHPRAAFLAADGRGFRLDPLQKINLEMYGAVGDCVAPGMGTPDTLAVRAAIAYASITGPGEGSGGGGAGTINVERRRYRMTERIEVKDGGVNIHGGGHTFNPGIVAGTNYPALLANEGTIFVFDPDVAGFIFYAQTDIDAGAYAGSTNADKFKFKGAQTSDLRDFAVIGGNPLNGVASTNTNAHGIEHRCIMTMTNVAVDSFAGEGIRNIASTSEVGIAYGISDGSVYTRVRARYNGGHGFYCQGDDSNVTTYINCDSALNGGAAYMDKNFLGNLYLNCHAATNNLSHPSNAVYGWNGPASTRARMLADWAELSDSLAGGYFCQSAVAANSYINCYIEGGPGLKSRMTSSCGVFGGNLGSAIGAEGTFYLDEQAFIINAGRVERRGIRAINATGAMAVGLGIGSLGTPQAVMSFGSGDHGNDYGEFNLAYALGGTGVWTLAFANSIYGKVLQIANDLAPPSVAGLDSAMRQGFPSGLVLGEIATAPRLLPARTSIPTGGDFGNNFRQGDWVPNSVPAISAGKVLLGWSRLTTGSGQVAGVDWTPIYGTTS